MWGWFYECRFAVLIKLKESHQWLLDEYVRGPSHPGRVPSPEHNNLYISQLLVYIIPRSFPYMKKVEFLEIISPPIFWIFRQIWGFYKKFFGFSAKFREAPPHQNGWIFGKVPNGGGVISNPKIFVANLRFAEITSWIGWGTTFDLRKAEISETH